MRLQGLVLVGLVVSLMGACGQSTDSVPEGSGGSTGNGVARDYSSAEPVELKDLCPLFTSDLCLYLMQCGELDYRDAAHCEAEMQCYGLEQLEQSAAAGHVDYRPDKVGACHARFVDDPCNFAFFLFTPDIFEVLGHCDGTLEPRQADGEACVSHGECMTGYCSKEGRTCPGECGTAGLAQLGESCAETDCAPDLDCDSESICRAPIAAGEPCGANFDCFDGSSSVRNGELVDGSLYCDRRTNTCMNSPVVGEACGRIGEDPATAFFSRCDLGWCDDDSPERPQGVCRADGELGEPCGDCVQGLRCIGEETAGTGRCEAYGGVGSSCTSQFRDCEEDLFCTPEGTCSEKLGVGASCTVDHGCQSDICGEAGTCLGAAYPGDDCSSPATECVFGLCQDGTCVRRMKVGEPCAENAECATGDCAGGVCVDDSVCASE